MAVKVSEELLADNAYDLETFLINAFGRAIANAEEEAFLTGDGSSKPTGIFHATKGGQVGVTAASATAITADEVIDLVYKLKRPYRTNAVFVTSDSTLAATAAGITEENIDMTTRYYLASQIIFDNAVFTDGASEG